MKTSAVIVALAAAAVSVDAANCATTPLRGLLLDKDCTAAVGFAWKPFRVYNETEISLFCHAPVCVTLLKSLVPLNPTECQIPGGSYPNLYADLLTPVFTCSDALTPAPTTPAPTTPAPTTPAPTTPAPTTPAPTTPAPTTVAPVITPAPSTTPEPTLPKPSC